jgi:hypothetical protein
MFGLKKQTETPKQSAAVVELKTAVDAYVAACIANDKDLNVCREEVCLAGLSESALFICQRIAGGRGRVQYHEGNVPTKYDAFRNAETR